MTTPPPSSSPSSSTTTTTTPANAHSTTNNNGSPSNNHAPSRDDDNDVFPAVANLEDPSPREERALSTWWSRQESSWASPIPWHRFAAPNMLLQPLWAHRNEVLDHVYTVSAYARRHLTEQERDAVVEYSSRELTTHHNCRCISIAVPAWFMRQSWLKTRMMEQQAKAREAAAAASPWSSTTTTPAGRTGPDGLVTYFSQQQQQQQPQPSSAYLRMYAASVGRRVARTAVAGLVGFFSASILLGAIDDLVKDESENAFLQDERLSRLCSELQHSAPDEPAGVLRVRVLQRPERNRQISGEEPNES